MGPACTQQSEGTPRGFTPALGRLPSATLVPAMSSQGSPSPPILSPSSALSGARRGGGHGAGRTEPTDHRSGTETALRRARCEAAAQDPPPRRGRHVPSVSAGRPRQRQRVPSGRHGGVVDVHTRASPAAEQLRVPVHVTRGGLARPHRCLLSPWQAPGEVSSRFTDEGAKAQRRYGVRSHSSGVKVGITKEMNPACDCLNIF